MASPPSAFPENAVQLLESISDAFFAVDQSWRLIYVNRQTEILLGQSRDQLIPQTLWNVFPENDDAFVRSRFKRALEDKEPDQFEAFYAPRNRWYKVHLYPFEHGISVYLSDVTHLKEVEQTLHEEEARAQSILDTTVDGIVTIDERGRIESFNQAAERIFGYEDDEVIGENVKILMPDPYREEHDDYLENYHRTGERKIIGIGREVTGRRKDGSTFPMMLAVSEVKVEERKLYTGIVRDISQQRHLEKEILETSENERRRIGQDLHDGLGQMLTGISLISSTVAKKLKGRDVPEAEQVKEIAQLVKEADQYARTLSRGLVPVQLDAGGLSAALVQLSKQVERLFKIDCTFQESDRVLIHESNTATNLYRIAQEAVSNAAKHGRATQVEIHLMQSSGRIALSVKDDGAGFEYDAHENGGMGLQIMKYRARMIGGTLEVHSTPDQGTRVLCSISTKPGRLFRE